MVSKSKSVQAPKVSSQAKENPAAAQSSPADIPVVPVPEAPQSSTENQPDTVVAAAAPPADSLASPSPVVPAEAVYSNPTASQEAETAQLKRITELTHQDTQESARELAAMLESTQTPKVLSAVLNGLLVSHHTETMSSEISAFVRRLYSAPLTEDALTKTAELLAKHPTRDSIAWLRGEIADSTDKSREAASAAGALLRMHKQHPNLISAEDAAQANNAAQSIFKTSTDNGARQQAVAALSTEENAEFLQNAWLEEQDPRIKAVLGRIVMVNSRSSSPAPGAGVYP